MEICPHCKRVLEITDFIWLESTVTPKLVNVFYTVMPKIGLKLLSMPHFGNWHWHKEKIRGD